jgi:hypothetical protein
MRTLLACLALSLAACATADDGADPAAQDQPTSTEHVTVQAPPAGLAPDTGESDVCACADDDCVNSWVADNLGCDVSAIIICGDDGSLEGFSPCAAQQ